MVHLAAQVEGQQVHGAGVVVVQLWVEQEAPPDLVDLRGTSTQVRQIVSGTASEKSDSRLCTLLYTKFVVVAQDSLPRMWFMCSNKQQLL